MSVVDQGDRAMLHFGGGHSLGVDVADFLQLQRPFQRDGIMISAAQEQPVFAIAEFQGDLLDLLALSSRTVSICSGMRAQPVDDFLALGLAHESPPAEVEREHRQHDALAGERLGAGDADFRAGVQIDSAVGFAGDGAADDVDNAQAQRAFFLGLRAGRPACRRFRRTG